MKARSGFPSRSKSAAARRDSELVSAMFRVAELAGNVPFWLG
jgi:hypothetical protein